VHIGQTTDRSDSDQTPEREDLHVDLLLVQLLTQTMCPSICESF
jgi:hypothetical protein